MQRLYEGLWSLPATAGKFALSTLRTDLLRTQAQFHSAACDKLARRANHPKPVQPLAQKYSAFVLTQINRITPPVRSEERRVGKECRARCWPYDRRVRKA